MKVRFNSFDIICAVTELQSLVGLRVGQIYDIDNKTFLIRFQSREDKKNLIIESGIRFHTTGFEWPKNSVPSGFSMKLRKHLKNKRLEKLQQLGSDRIVDFQFGIGVAAYHIILELYDRGNIVLTDHEMTILYILRPHYEGEDIRFTVHEKYPFERARRESALPTEDQLRSILAAQTNDSLEHLIMPMVDCGPAVIQHVLKKHKLDTCIILKEKTIEKIDESIEIGKKSRKIKKKRAQSKKYTRTFNMQSDIETLLLALQDILEMIKIAKQSISKGYIIQKKEPLVAEGNEIEYFYQSIEYHPYDFSQYEGELIVKFESFMFAVDEFYSTCEAQKIEMKTLQHEREALKKLSNVKKDHAKRIGDLNKLQEGDKLKAELITANQGVVDNAIVAIRSAVAKQMSWPDIQELVKAAQATGDPVAGAIKQLKLETNHILLNLSDPYKANTDDKTAAIVEVDLALTAWANARKYYDQKRSASHKEQKTIDASQKALKSAERKTFQILKDVRTISTISKARKVYWFEKFYWFISSENYLVIGGRDAQQNELIVKRYMRSSDIYVHAEIQGASSVVVRNPTDYNIPPKTLLEAGTMAISYSVAWDAKVITTAYWVRSNQVTKSAPTGEYLGTGSFMVRGKKNFLPSCQLVMGLSLLFKLEDSFIENHRGERKVRSFSEEQKQQAEPQLRTKLLTDNILYDILEEEVKNNNEKGQTPDVNMQLKPEFPDIHVKVEHDTGRKSVKNEDDKISSIIKVDEATIISAMPSRKKQQLNSKKRKDIKDRKSQEKINHLVKNQQTLEDNQTNNFIQVVKRGQKGKLKKLKSKYKDQDEEERQIRMQILNSAGKINDTIIYQKVDEETSLIDINELNRPNEQKQLHQGNVENADDVPTGADDESIDSLTGQPFQEDEVLFVIPVVAPYQALQNYKYKVKLTPGTGKRGRAAKSALAMFSRDKLCTPREKDLLKTVRDEALARNIPGKVKLSAPQLQKIKT